MADMQKRTKRVQDPDVDFISDLPEGVIETILMFLPTRDAARTCILSKKWRYRWVKVPQLILDDALWQQTMRNQNAPRAKFAMIACQIVSLHQGLVTKFTLSLPELKSCQEMDALVCYASRNRVEDFTLRMWLPERYRMPLSFFMAAQLKHLYLHSCSISLLPSPFKGFPKLITLELLDVKITTGVLESIISSSPSLEKVVLQIANVLGYFEIKAPKLRHLAIFALFRSDRRTSIVDVFGKLPVLEHLDINYHFIKYLAASGFPTRLPTTLANLKDLNVSSVCLDEVDLLSCALCLIRSSPNLQKIDISLRSFEVADTRPVEEYLYEQDYADVTLNHLEEVKLRCVSCKKSEMELIKLLLAKSPILKKLILVEPFTDARAHTGLNFLSELPEFQRASPYVKVIVEDREQHQT